jgi:hypothetical protein
MPPSSALDLIGTPLLRPAFRSFEDRAASVAALGFTARQARFLTLVALHSGYCLRRQYSSFGALSYGKNVRNFLDGLVDRQLARRVTFRADRGHVYHLLARCIYGALQQEDNRNRRYASPALIARKLMVLDFVLDEPERDWFVTEQEKLHLFAECLHVPPHALPRRSYDSVLGASDPTVRYFIHKLPIFLTNEPARVHFVCLVTDPDATDVTLFLKDHRALLSHLSSWTLVVIRPAHISTDERCAQQFARALQSADLVPHALDAATTSHFFHTRRRIELGELKRVSVADIKRYRELHDRVGHRMDALYSRWQELGDAALQTLERPKNQGVSPETTQLIIHKLPHRYEQFGALPGLV